MAIDQPLPSVIAASHDAVVPGMSGTRDDALGLCFKRRLWVPVAMFLADWAAFEGALYCGFLTRKALAGAFPIIIKSFLYEGLAWGMLALPAVFLLEGLYPGYGLGAVERMRRRVYGTVVVFTVLGIWDYLVQNNNWSRGILLASFGYALVLPFFSELVLRKFLIRIRCWGQPVLVLGAARTGRMMIKLLKQEPWLGLVPVAVLDDDTKTWGRDLEGVPVRGGLDRVACFKGRVKTVILSMPGVGRDRIVALLAGLAFPRVIVVPDLFGMESASVTTRDFGGVLALEIKKNLLLKRNWALKRSSDYLLGVPLFLLSTPLLACFAVWIKLVSRGPAFFAQERVGRGGKPIRVWKLRTMHPDAERMLQEHFEREPAAKEEWARHFKLKNDPRVLPRVGTLLRHTSLDELPQLWNVVRGEMSLVGPRPFPAYHLEQFPPDFLALRQSVMPGMTGLWQVAARSDGDLNIQQAHDTYYIRNWSLWLDFYLLLRTAKVVLLGTGAY